jgi:hypothetical protein
MISKSGERFSDKIMRRPKMAARYMIYCNRIRL